MNETYKLLLAFVVGLTLGTSFFYGLWLTIEKTTTSSNPGLWIIASIGARLLITLMGFYFVCTLSLEHQLDRVLLCLFGFLIARLFVTKIVKAKTKLALLRLEVENAS